MSTQARCLLLKLWSDTLVEEMRFAGPSQLLQQLRHQAQCGLLQVNWQRHKLGRRLMGGASANCSHPGRGGGWVCKWVSWDLGVLRSLFV